MTLLDVPTVRSIARQSFYAYANLCATAQLGDKNLMTPAVHKPLCDWIQEKIVNENAKRLSINDPRNHIKTTLCTRFFPKWLLFQTPDERYDSPEEFERATEFLRQRPHLLGVNERFLIGSGSKDNSVRQIRGIQAFPENNTLFRTYFPEFCPEQFDVLQRKRVWNAEEFIHPSRTVDYPEPTFDSAGVTSRSTSRHYSGIIYDDPINETNWESEPEIKTAIDWLLFCENLLEVADINKPNAGFVILIGNFWTYYDVQSYVLENMPTYDIWHRKCWVCSECGRGNCRRDANCVKTDEPLWPERWTREGLARLKTELTARIFMAQYENDPIAGEHTTLEADRIRNCRYELASGNVIWYRPDSSVVPDRTTPLSTLRGVISIDPATSTDPRSCRSAVGVFAEDPETQAVAKLDLLADRLDPHELVNKVIDLYVKWRERGLRIAHVGVETVAGQKFFVPALVSAAKLRARSGENCGALAQTPSGRPEDLIQFFRTDRKLVKEERIQNLLGWRLREGLLYVDTLLPYRELFFDELIKFPVARSTDVIDETAYAEQLYARVMHSNKLIDIMRNKHLRRRAHATYAGVIY